MKSISAQQAFFPTAETVLQHAGYGGFGNSTINSGAVLISQDLLALKMSVSMLRQFAILQTAKVKDGRWMSYKQCNIL